MPPDAVHGRLRQLGADSALSALGARTDDELWDRLASNRNGELHLLAMQIGVPPLTILEVLAQSAMRTAGKYRPVWWKRHALDYTVVIALSGFAALAGLAWVHRPALRTIQVVAARDIAPFTPIQTTDVKPDRTGREPGAEQKPDEVLNRYSLQPIRAGAVVTSNALSAGKLAGSMAGRTVLGVSVVKTDSVAANSLPRVVTLIVSPRESGDKGKVIPDVYLLSLSTGDSPRAVVALRADSVEDFAAAIGSGTVYIAVTGR